MNDRMKFVAIAYAVVFVFMALVSSTAILAVRCCSPERDTVENVKVRTVRDTIVKVDTVRFPVPTLFYRYVTKTVELEDTVLEYEQKIYRDSSYTAYVSGIDAELDSIQVYPRLYVFRDSITVEKDYYINRRIKKPRIRLGMSAGYYITPKGLQPGVGGGVIIEF